ncbi:MAG: methylated-DNA--[protein]-cysteine S-methyltransferase, partial [Solirubrobacteraceae bacterium]|nr:methylated-DNA--[protein]-cysteine S-methyltransferase [Solirubrobacteraceae bacterium]
MTILHTTIETPIGPLLLTGDGGTLTGLAFQGGPNPRKIEPDWREDAEAFTDVVAQLDEYFAGTRTAFDVPLAFDGTPFQVAVWEQLRTIPYGETITYGELAERVGKPSAMRAVGATNGRNPIGLIVPCHR